MDADEIEVGKSYAYVQGHHAGPQQPVRAVVDAEPKAGLVEVTLHFPDTGQDQLAVKTRELVGEWEAEPTGQQYTAALRIAREQGETLTWQHIADLRYDEVRRQRALAGRLLAFGIHRSRRNYAGRGGAEENAHHTLLQLNYGELEVLLDAAERGPGATIPYATALTPKPAQESSFLVDENPG